ncbi:enoyl-CoA hydratase/isomerase family protein [Planococcus ruber]|uniref:enoyl-CoA hydratase/isomerase family protein n=1 Tax=Planococcus ruber TaxID=2027871 RepID=UPI001FEFF3F0|nr:enoyl-CoA hydratase/isomerase family protein [Planococcus ruber]MCJ1907149.1 enoyl-CoA hydratase/isomerase family protein [Planococcus ruber]
MSYKIDLSGGILTFTIDRPHIRNAINDEVIQGLEELVAQVHNHDPQFVIITASGEQAFCSGGDLSVYQHLRTRNEAYPMLKKMGDVLYRIKTLPVPVVALVNGMAVGGGCEIATACDYRLVLSHVKCGFIQGTLAITSGWGGGTYAMETMPHAQALKMLSEARVYTAQELLENGWATKVVESEADVEAFFQSMKKIRPEVHRAYKEIAIRKWQSSHLKDRVSEEIRLCAELWEADAHHDAVERFLNKKK